MFSIKLFQLKIIYKSRAIIFVLDPSDNVYIEGRSIVLNCSSINRDFHEVF